MRTKRVIRQGFTLVELLVVISIIGMLMALLFPAVQAARETARGNTCRNNLRNLAIAAKQYEGRRDRYPGYVDIPSPAGALADITYAKSWLFMVLPFMERTDIYDAYAGIAAQPTQVLDIAQCPSDPPDGLSQLPHSSYIANSGMQDVPPAVAGEPPADWPGNGVFQDLAHRFDSAGDRLNMTQSNEAYVSNGDGTANTIMFTENVDALSWTLTGMDTNWEREQGCVWWPNVDPTTVSGPYTPLNPPDGAVDTALPSAAKIMNNLVGGDTSGVDITFARPGAYHPGGANFAFCDTHARFLSQDIDYLVFCQLMTPRARNAQLPGAIPTDATDPQDAAFPDPIFRYLYLDEDSIQ